MFYHVGLFYGIGLDRRKLLLFLELTVEVGLVLFLFEVRNQVPLAPRIPQMFVLHDCFVNLRNRVLFYPFVFSHVGLVEGDVVPVPEHLNLLHAFF